MILIARIGSYTLYVEFYLSTIFLDRDLADKIATDWFWQRSRHGTGKCPSCFVDIDTLNSCACQMYSADGTLVAITTQEGVIRSGIAGLSRPQLEKPKL